MIVNLRNMVPSWTFCVFRRDGQWIGHPMDTFSREYTKGLTELLHSALVGRRKFHMVFENDETVNISPPLRTGLLSKACA